MSTAVEAKSLELATLLGECHVSSDPASCAAYTVDGSVPKWVVYPSSAEQVAAVLQYASDRDFAVIPCRNTTKLAIGNPPRRYDAALSVKEMNRVWYYEPDDLTVSVEPGMKLGDFQRFVGRRGLWLPLDPPGGAKASIGGIVATNAAGPLRLQYGAPRDMVLGLKIATTEGKVIKAGGRVVKNVAGYDLVKLLIGSYGTLGVIVEATLKLYPLPGRRATFAFSVKGFETASALRRRILLSPLQPLRMILLDAAAAGLVRTGSARAAEAQGAEMWVEAGGSSKVIERYAHELEALGRETGAPLRSVEEPEAEVAWARISDLRTWVIAADTSVVILKALVPITASEEFLARAGGEADASRVRLASFAQTGVGVVQLCLWGTDTSRINADLVVRLREQAAGLGGALVVEHGSASLKGELEVWGPPGDDFEVQRKLKAAWDPKGILSPGRFAGRL